MAPLYCSVGGCFSNSRTPNVRFFCFPGQKERCFAWIKFCGDDDLMKNWESKMAKNAGRYKVCSLHFKTKDFMNIHMDKLVKGVVPSLNGPPSMKEYVAMFPIVASSVYSASSPSDTEPSTPPSSPLPSGTLANSIQTPCISSIPSTSSINLYPGPSDGDIVRTTESSCKKNRHSLSRIGVSKQTYCTPCKRLFEQYRKQKELEIKKLRTTNLKLEQLLQTMMKRLANHQSTIVDTQISSDVSLNADP